MGAALLIVLGSAHLLFHGYFPGPNGLGHDYSFFFPDLLANYYWARMEGPWSPPWFTPAFCGGRPAFPDPQSLYYSLPQALVAFVDPVSSVYMTLLTFMAIGFAGTFLFLRRSLTLSIAASIVGATLFALNGFFSHRMLIGHLALHGIMLLPWLALALTVSSGDRRTRPADALLGGLAAALVLTYWIVGGMVVLFIPALLATIALIAIYGLRGGSLQHVSARAVVAVLVSLALTASKIVGVFAYTSHFPRTGYLLPGMADLWATLNLTFAALFWTPAEVAVIANENLTNFQWLLERHEFEFGVTPVPIFLIGSSLALWLYRKAASEQWPKLVNWRSFGFGAVLFLILSIPLAVNTYGPEWNAFLKSVPVIGSSSNLFRWLLVYIPVISVASAFAVDGFSSAGRVRLVVGVTAFVAVLLGHTAIDRRYYASQKYDPKPVAAAFLKARTSDFPPPVSLIGANFDPAGRILVRGNNDFLAHGASQLGCSNPMFGYNLEFFPIGSLHPGNPMETANGYLNVKDPACYLYPKENKCVPGGHFPVERSKDAKRFLEYRSYPFNRSASQHAGDLLNGAGPLLFPLLLTGGLFWRRRLLGSDLPATGQ